MKKIILLASLLSFSFLNAYSQSKCELNKAEEITWYGIDFSMAKFLGPDFNDPQAIKSTFFKSWNTLLVNEAEKFNLKSFYQKTNVLYQLEEVMKRNDKVNEFKMVDLNATTNDIPEAQIKSLINEFNFESKEGFGALMVVNHFSKSTVETAFNIVFVDLKTKTILLNEKVKGTPRGFGFRNFWAGGIYEALKKSQEIYQSEMASCQ